MQTLWQDLRYGARLWMKNPGLTAVAFLTLAIGIGATTAIFTVVNATLLRGLPYRQSERLYHLWESMPRKDFQQREASYPDYQDWQQNQVFDGMAAYTGGSVIMSGRGEPERLFGPAVTANFFSVLGVEALHGRTFREGEDQPSAEHTVVLSYGLWQRLTGGDPTIIGQSLTLDGEAYTVIGILPPDFHFALRIGEVWLPYQPSQAQLTRRFMHGTNVIARLKDGVSLQQAETEMQAIGRHIEEQHNDSHAGTTIKLVPLQEQIVGQVKPIVLALFGAVGLVLLIACANLANLLLARATVRQKEIAIRTAVGARRGRIIRQLLTEACLVALIGGLLGLLVAQWGVDALLAAIPESQLNAMPYLKGVTVDWGVLGFAFVLSLTTGVLFGLVPALQASRTDLQSVLKEGGKSASQATRHRLRNALVMTEVALSLVLLVGAGLMTKSLMQLLHVDLGFKEENLLTMRAVLPPSKYQQDEQLATAHQQTLTRLAALPGVESVGTIDLLPLIGGNTSRFIVEGEAPPPPGQEPEANVRTISTNYFDVMEVPLKKGRVFSQQDHAQSQPVVIVSQTFADRVLPNQEIIGRRIKAPVPNWTPVEIIGVVGDVKTNDLDTEIKPVVYFTYLQDSSLSTSLVVRTKTDPAAVAAIVRAEYRKLEPDVTIFSVRTMQEIMQNAPATFLRRYPALLIGLFSLIALLLAAVGIYGVMSYSVSQQTHDIGVRLALGARPSDILRMVIKQGMIVALSGVAIGLSVAFVLARLFTGLLFQVSAADPLTFSVVAVILIATALLACYLPARRATKVNPLVALRYE